MNLEDGRVVKIKATGEKDEDDGTVRFHFDLRHNGERIGDAGLDIFLARPGHSEEPFAHLHPTILSEYQEQGIGTQLYEFAAEIAGLYGAVLTATDSLSDAAWSLWESLEDKGISTGWTIDRRKKL